MTYPGIKARNDTIMPNNISTNNNNDKTFKALAVQVVTCHKNTQCHLINCGNTIVTGTTLVRVGGCQYAYHPKCAMQRLKQLMNGIKIAMAHLTSMVETHDKQAYTQSFKEGD